ncbi:MAG: hypothetical protein ACI3T9_02915 [Romboutsia timonensis]
MYANLERIYNKLIEKHKIVQTCSIDEEIYMYKPLNKMEYELLSNQIEDELDFQDAVVQNCILYPENIDIDEMLPGTVFELAKLIMDQSYISPEDRILMLEAYSSEMTQLDNIMICLIMHAFPAYKLEDLEVMTYPELYKLYTRAEWFLTNVLQDKTLEFSALDTLKQAVYEVQQNDYSDYYNNGHDESEENEVIQQEQPEQPQGKYMGRNLNEVMAEINNSGSKRKPMTEEQKRELERFKQQFPDIDMNQDAMYTGLLSEKAGVARNTPRQKY